MVRTSLTACSCGVSVCVRMRMCMHVHAVFFISTKNNRKPYPTRDKVAATRSKPNQHTLRQVWGRNCGCNGTDLWILVQLDVGSLVYATQECQAPFTSLLPTTIPAVPLLRVDYDAPVSFYVFRSSQFFMWLWSLTTFPSMSSSFARGTAVGGCVI